MFRIEDPEDVEVYWRIWEELRDNQDRLDLLDKRVSGWKNGRRKAEEISGNREVTVNVYKSNGQYMIDIVTTWKGPNEAPVCLAVISREFRDDKAIPCGSD